MMVALGVLLSIYAHAYDFKVGNFYYNITSLQSLTVEVTNAGDNAPAGNYSGDVVIPSTVSYSNKIFTVTRLGDYSFSNCKNMTSISIPNMVTSIGKYTFRNCRSLTSLQIPSSVTKIDQGTFTGCSNLSKLILEDGNQHLYLTYKEYQVGNYACFLDCPLKYVYLGRTISGSFGRVEDLYHAAFYKQKALTSLVIGPQVTALCDFVGCSNLETLEIPANVQLILRWGFAYCSSIKEIFLQEGLERINQSAFMGCQSVTTVHIPSTIKSVETSVFENCTNIKTVYSASITPIPIPESTFPGIVYLNAVLYVPTGTKELYKETDGWKDFANIMEVGEGETPEVKKCATPTIAYANGKLVFECTTAGAECVANISDTDIKTHYGNEIDLTVTYNVSVYATATGYDNSETATATLCWIDKEPQTEGLTTSMAEVNARPVLIQSRNCVLTITGETADETIPVNVYNMAGIQTGSTMLTDGTAIIDTHLQSGETAIVRIGNRAVKVLVK